MKKHYTLGIAYGYHDSSATLVGDGEVLASSTEDRFSRQKHDAGFPREAIQFCLSAAGVQAKDLSEVAFHEDPHEKFTRVLCSAFSGFPFTYKEFVNSTKSWLGTKLWTLNRISRELGVGPDKIYYLNHHFSHALNAFLGSGFPRASVMVMDAVGDWACAALYQAEWINGRPEVRKVHEIQFPDSLCLVYSAFTEFLGFRPNDGECSVMALAAFGKPRFEKEIRQFVKREKVGYRLDQSFFHFLRFYQGSVSQRFRDLFGSPRQSREPLHFNVFGGPVDPAEQRFADIAASIQKVYEDTCVDLLAWLRNTGHSENLCLAGGGAMNCVANAVFLERSGFAKFYVPPDPGDGGSSVGAALYTNLLRGGPSADPARQRYTPYVGATYAAKDELDYLPELDGKKFVRFARTLNPAAILRKWGHGSFSDEEQLLDFVAERVTAGKIVGFFSGRFEIGPRALGARSILCRPGDVALATRLSKAVKKRAVYRPYALSLLDSCAEDVLALASDHQLYRWMQATAAVRPEYLERVRAAAHIDGTTRPHVCVRGEHPRFYRLLEKLHQRTGLGAVLNTSFNESGFPLVASPTDALAMFARTDMDVLVCDQVFVEKEAGG